MKQAENFSILFWLRKNKQNEAGLIPLYCRITYNQKRSVFSTGLLLLEAHFMQKNEMVVGPKREAQLANAKLIEIRNRLRDLESELSRSGREVTAELIRDTYFNKKQPTKTLLEAFKWHNENFSQKVNSGNRCKGTLIKFKATTDKVAAFIKWNFRANDLPLSAVKGSFAEEFEHYLMVEQKLSHNTIMKHIRNLKKILLMCVQKEWMARNPISAFKCSYNNPTRKVLLESDLERLRSTKISIARLDEVRDCFLFMCYTGFAYQDAAALGHENIVIKIDGRRWLTKPRIKTEVDESVPLLPFVQELIDKYKPHPYCINAGKLLPFNSNQRMNAYLKEIGTLCKIPFDLTTHLARHTFATTVTLANGVPLETVQYLLGHRSIRTTQHYAKVLAQTVSADMDNLIQALSAKQRKKQVALQ